VRGGNHVVLRISLGTVSFSPVGRLYLRSTTVRRLNRRRKHKPAALPQQAGPDARDAAADPSFALPTGHPVYVLSIVVHLGKAGEMDSPQGWHVIAAVKPTRYNSIFRPRC